MTPDPPRHDIGTHRRHSRRTDEEARETAAFGTVPARYRTCPGGAARLRTTRGDGGVTVRRITAPGGHRRAGRPARPVPRRRAGVPRRPLRRSPGRGRTAAGPRARAPVARGAGGHPTVPRVPAVLALRPERSGGRQRGLPVPGRVPAPDRPPRSPAPGDRLDARGCVQPGNGNPVRRADHGRPHAERGGQHQLPAGAARLSRAARARPGERPALRVLRADGPARGVALDPGEHRRVRRESGQRHDLWAVGGQRFRLRAAGRPAGRRAVPPGRAAERSVHAAGYAGQRGRRDTGAVLRRAGGLHRIRRGRRVPARRLRVGAGRGGPCAAHAGSGLR